MPLCLSTINHRPSTLFDAESGGVTVSVDGEGNLRIEGFLSASPLVLKPR